MNYHIICLLFFFTGLSIHGQKEVRGVTTDSNYMYYIFEENMYCHDMKTDKNAWIKNLHTDTNIVNFLYESIRIQQNIRDDSNKTATKASINKFKAINITSYGNKLYIGIRYQIQKIFKAAVKYAVLEFDKSLKLSNTYLFALTPRYKYFTLPPFFELTFNHRGDLLLPLYENNRIILCNFKMHKKSHKVIPNQVIQKIGISNNKINLKSPDGIILDPIIYPVSNSHFKYYFQYPFPVVKTLHDDVIDPFLSKPFIDSCVLSKNHTHFGDFSYQPDFSNTAESFPNTLLSSWISNDSLYILATSKKFSSINLVYINTKTNEKAFKVIDYPLEDHYYIIKDKSLLILNVGQEKHKVQAHPIQNLFNR